MATQVGVVESANRLQSQLGAQSSQEGALRASRIRRHLPLVQSGERKQEPESHNLLLAMAPLVKRVAFEMRQHLPPHVEMDDLVGAGTLGLVDALRKFDPSRKVKLESYARHRIRGGILDALRTLDPATRDMRRRARKVETTYRELEARLGRPVQDEEMARALGISLKVWHRWAREVHVLGPDGWQRCETAAAAGKLPRQEEGWMAVPQEDPFDLCYRREQRDLLNRALARLPERERLIVTLYYQQDLTMKEIAARLEVDESRVSQLHAEALERLKARVRASLCPPKQVALAVASSAGLAA
jgi:RNA polymerase sigma factor for flagellar operon FliA